jgi:hypothetical protein
MYKKRIVVPSSFTVGIKAICETLGEECYKLRSCHGLIPYLGHTLSTLLGMSSLTQYSYEAGAFIHICTEKETVPYR